MTSPKLKSRYRRKTVSAILGGIVILISVIARISTGGGPRVDALEYGVRVAKPENMKQFPAELMPMP